ncbi:MAG: MarR family transcriptional regulator, partial [Actinomycetia bacterium]|nr:MarR family transcriptional regulator [Actinomycetes bacterium]
MTPQEQARHDLANRLFFRLYQCANMLHKTGTRAVESEGLTTQRWAVMGALSRPEAVDGMAVGDLARYLKVSRQSLSGITTRLEDDGLIATDLDPADRRSRRLRLTS